MHASFYPPLGAHMRIPVNSPFIDYGMDEDRLPIVLTARLTSQDYAEAVQTGLRIEAWTNAPSGVRPAGQWGPVAFEEVEEGVTAPFGEEIEPSLSLDADDQAKLASRVEAHASQPRVFRAALTLPRIPGLVFAYTYRLVYPSGICWLGSDRDNGVLEPVSETPFFEEIGSWETSEGEGRLVDVLASKQSTEAEDCAVVGKLDVAQWSWAGWATDGLRVWSFNDNCLEPIEDVRLAFLVPTALHDAILEPQSFILRATSEDARISITAQGHVVLSSRRTGGAVAYRVHASNSGYDFELLRRDVLSSCSAPFLVPTNNIDTLLFTPNYDSDVSVTIYAQPLTRRPSPLQSISLPITVLDTFAKQATTLCFCIPEIRSTLFVDRSERSGDVWLRFGPSGAQVTVSVVYCITSSDPHTTWQFALPGYSVTPEQIMDSGATDNPLPTPPASPRTKPQRTVTFALSSESDKDEMIEHQKPSEAETPTIDKSTTVQHIGDSNSAFERYQAASGSDKVKVLVINVLRMLSRFLGVAVIRLFLFVFRLTGKYAKSPRAETDAGDSGTSSPPLQGTFELKAETEGEIPSGDYGASGMSSSVERRIVESPDVGSWSALSTEEREGGEQERSIASFGTVPPVLKWILLPDGDTRIRLVVRSNTTPNRTFEHLSIELNGEVIDKISSVHAVGDRISLIEMLRPEGVTSVLQVKLTS